MSRDVIAHFSGRRFGGLPGKKRCSPSLCPSVPARSGQQHHSSTRKNQVDFAHAGPSCPYARPMQRSQAGTGAGMAEGKVSYACLASVS